MKRLFTLALAILSLSNLRAEQEEVFTPELFGVVKVKMEASTDNGEYRFDVRNSRIGVKGNASERMNYAIQIDYNNEGNISILDSWVGYHVEGFDIRLGQQQLQFSTDLDRGPSSSPFSNRSFLAKYITTYFKTTASADGMSVSNGVSTMSSRDIGVHVGYKIPKTIIKLSGGLFNGSGSNSPEWGSSVNGVARVDIGGSSGLAGAVSYYGGVTPTDSYALYENDSWVNITQDQRIDMFDGYLRYIKGDLFCEAEYAQRRINQAGDHVMQAFYVHATYRIGVNDNPIFKYIAPHLRWDMGKNVEYYDNVTGDIFHYNAKRMTYAVNFGLSEKRIRSELRLAYEDYFLKEKPADFGVNKLLHDKFTIELVAAF